jgi:membrane associated rhomboid family serine protease
MFRTVTEGVKHLLIINVIMFGATLLISQTNPELMYSLFGLYFPENNIFQPWQIISHMFMHGDLMHLIFNMVALYMFGTAVEQVYGTNKFIFLYFSCGLGAALISLTFSYYSFYSVLDIMVSNGISKSDVLVSLNSLNEGKNINEALVIWQEVINQSDFNTLRSAFNTSMVGASGAIMGILVAFGFLFPESKLMLLFLPFPVKAKYFIPGIILLDLFSAVTGTSIFSPSNTAYIAHLGGAFTGFLIMYYWKKNQFNSSRWN